MSLVNRILKGVRNLTLASILALSVGCSSSSKVNTPSYVPQTKTYQEQNSNASLENLEEYLYSELAKRVDVNKTTTKPPTGQENAVDDLELRQNIYGQYYLTWSYKNVGDYNQDGIVDVKDVTPLAIYFGKESPLMPPMGWVPGPFWRGDWVDGNKDGIINVQDVTPLAANFGNECAGYKVQIYLNPETPGYEWDEIGFNLADPGFGRKRFWFHKLTGETIKPGMTFYVYPMDSEGCIYDTVASNRVTVP
ncbi:hypothetical protein B6U80_00445 [Candidatus Pacearchaeota archaeon ex4484_26]|nr:MAG: hypothetical protein B6U80_00445 [Candidatus Pacearchaeota archaeon ex4484_26]